jgi:hypothetical protein
VVRPARFERAAPALGGRVYARNQARKRRIVTRSESMETSALIHCSRRLCYALRRHSPAERPRTLDAIIVGLLIVIAGILWAILKTLQAWYGSTLPSYYDSDN